MGTSATAAPLSGRAVAAEVSAGPGRLRRWHDTVGGVMAAVCDMTGTAAVCVRRRALRRSGGARGVWRAAVAFQSSPDRYSPLPPADGHGEPDEWRKKKIVSESSWTKCDG